MAFEQLGGLDTTNLLVSISLVTLLLVASKITKILDNRGTIAAAIVGVLVGVAGHWSWLIILLSFLASSHYATKWNWEEKKAKGFCESEDGARGWKNVVANGGIPAIAAIWAFYSDNWSDMFWVISCGVAVAASDTWASEFGCLDERSRMITNLRACEPGVNGGFSPNGQVAALAGSAFIASVAFIAGWIPGNGDFMVGLKIAGIITVIGWIGCQIDSLLGAILENRGLMTKGTVNAAAITCGMLLACWLINSLNWL